MAYQGVRLRENLSVTVLLVLAASCGGKSSNDGTEQSVVTGGTSGTTVTATDGGVSGARPATTAGAAGRVGTGGVSPATGGVSSPGTGGKANQGGTAGTGGKLNAGAPASGGLTSTGGATGIGGAVVTGGSSSSGGSTDTVDAGSILDDFCVGAQSKVLYGSQEALAPATSYESALVMDCCNAYGVNLHTMGTLGFDFVIETIWSVGGSTGTGIFALGDSDRPMRAMVDRSPVTPISARVRAFGTANLITAFSYQDPFDLGLCLDVGGKQGLPQPTLIYVPKVTIANYASRSRLQIFLLNDSTITPAQASAQPLDSLALAQYALLDLGNIAYVTSATDEIGLNPGAKIGDNVRAQLSGLGVPFVVIADGVRVFLGTFVSPVSSMIYPGPIIFMDTIASDSMRLSPASTGNDPLKDARIVKALTETGKLIP